MDWSPEVGVTKAPLINFPVVEIFFLAKYTLSYSLNHIYIWQVSLQLSCSDTCQIWMWYSVDKPCFDNSEKKEYNGNWLSKPHPILTMSADGGSRRAMLINGFSVAEEWLALWWMTWLMGYCGDLQNDQTSNWLTVASRESGHFNKNTEMGWSKGSCVSVLSLHWEVLFW